MHPQSIRVQQLKADWLTNPRWANIERPNTAEEVLRLRGSFDMEYSLAKEGAKKFWHKLHTQDWVAGLGALTGNQAIQEAAAGLDVIYLSGWQVAADNNLAGTMYPDQSLYPVIPCPM
jgi:isocitrate lyase